MSAGDLAAFKTLLLPPGINLVLAACAMALLRRRKTLAMTLLIVSLVTLYLFSTPAIARQFAGLLEARWRGAVFAPEGAGAIVVLGCNRYANAPERGGQDDVSACTLVRLRRAAELNRETGLPLLLSGGRVFGEPLSEAELMAQAMRSSFGVEPRWLETDSTNTAQNAAHSARILLAGGIGRVILVTHALHMMRAERSFRRAGIEVLPAATHFQSAPDSRPAWLAWLPSASALAISNLAAYEALGNFYYALTGR